ncbi:adhesion G-protein coupled receptor G1-like isoform X2 [Sander vitreus]
MGWITWVSFVGLLWIYPVCNLAKLKSSSSDLKKCLLDKKTNFVVDNFNGFITKTNHSNLNCIVFLQKNASQHKSNQTQGEEWPQIVEKNNFYDVLLSKWYINKKWRLYFLKGKCNPNSDLKDFSSNADPTCVVSHNDSVLCQIRCLDTATVCQQSSFDENTCNEMVPPVNDRYIINIRNNCFNCDNPVKKPDEKIQLNVTIKTEGGKLNAAQAAAIMNNMANLATSITGSSAALTVAEGVTGVLVKQKEPANLQKVLLAYRSSNDSMSMIENKETLTKFSRSITVSKEAFEKANLNSTTSFVAVLRFLNLALDKKNSTVLENEVLAIEMGSTITNLTDKMQIHFWNMKYKGIPSCQSWNGEGSQPNWTDNGCQTIHDGQNISCECSHLTFFAILMSPLNETLSSSNLNYLTIITQVGCGLSMFFLCIVIFMHFLLRRTKASNATRLLVHLVSAMCLLNFTFLINNFVANLKNSVGCKIMAALMHYFMLTTFTWFAVQAFHLCLQIYTGGQIVIHRYILKVSIVSWVLPSVVVIVLLILEKYGEQVIYTNDSEQTAAMCWITDDLVHYVVNIGYYVLVFIFTFITFIVILSWLFFLKRTRIGPTSTHVKKTVIILGLCCMLGITWGFAFFAYGALQITSYYIFTVLNSFQGFFLFIYYYNTSHTGETTGHKNAISTNTVKTSLDIFENPYTDPHEKKKKP